MRKKISLLTLLLVSALLVSVGTAAAQPANFRTHLQGDGEVPPVDTQGQGQAIFQLNKAGDELSFKLIAANIEDVTQAHIHCGTPGVNGPVVAFLYGFGPIVSPNGILSEGTITADNVIPRPDSLACPGGVDTFEDLIAKIRSGGAYVNVHTEAKPGGEIRGHIH